MAGKPKSPRLWQEIILALALKIILLTAIWLAWFSTPADRTLDGDKMAAQILSSTSQKEPHHDAVSRAR